MSLNIHFFKEEKNGKTEEFNAFQINTSDSLAINTAGPFVGPKLYEDAVRRILANNPEAAEQHILAFRDFQKFRTGEEFYMEVW